MMIKRIIDVLLSLAIFIVFLPIIFLLSIILLLIQGKPIIFRQLRPGLNEKSFELYKFRTMEKDPNDYLAKGTKEDSLRLTRFGKFLRSTSLDELPSIINVIKGDMSLVGPRPLLMHYLDLYNDEQKMRHLVKPGITGWTQIKGRNSLSWEEKFKLDIWYVENSSILLDIKILLLTVIKVIKREGISSSGQETGAEFKGSKNRD